MKRDGIYARYSSHAQDDGTSIEVQLEQCERAAGAACVHYIDRAKTGRAAGGRTALLAMLADAEAGKLARVFVYKFDRLGRDAETHVIARQLEDAGVELVSATEGTNALARGIQLVVAEDYSRQLAARTRDGLLKRFEQGAFTGGVAPYGYRVETRDGRRVLAIDDAEADVVRDVVRQYLGESVGFKIIARRLRQRGVASRRGTGWAFNSVRSLLTNPVLTGRIRYNVRRMHLNRSTGRRVPRWKGEGEILERRDESLRIISDTDFDAIQDRLQRSTQIVRAPRGVAPFTGLAFCACGSRLTRKKSTRKGHTYFYWTCSRQLRYEDCTQNGRAREDALLAIVQDRFAGVFDQKDRVVARAVEIAREAARGNRADADRINGELADIDRQQARCVQLLMDAELSGPAKAAINRQMTEAENRRAELLGAVDGLREQAAADLDGLADAIDEAFAEARESLAAAATPEQFNRLVEDFFGPFVVGQAGDVTQKQLPPAVAEGSVHRCIAGARSLPGRVGPDELLQAVFWARRAA